MAKPNAYPISSCMIPHEDHACISIPFIHGSVDDPLFPLRLKMDVRREVLKSSY